MREQETVTHQQVTGIHHAAFQVSDLDRSVSFYRDVLGLELVVERNVQGGYMAELMGYPGTHLRLAFLRAGNELLELIQYLEPVGNPVDTTKYNPGTAHVCFRVSDLKAVYRHVLEQGASIQSGPVAITSGPNRGGFAMYLYDSDGIAVELLQTPVGPPAGSSPEA